MGFSIVSIGFPSTGIHIMQYYAISIVQRVCFCTHVVDIAVLSELSEKYTYNLYETGCFLISLAKTWLPNTDTLSMHNIAQF